jgi:hypothetical protein
MPLYRHSALVGLARPKGGDGTEAKMRMHHRIRVPNPCPAVAWALSLLLGLGACAHHTTDLAPTDAQFTLPQACSRPTFMAQRGGGRVAMVIAFDCPEEGTP